MRIGYPMVVRRCGKTPSEDGNLDGMTDVGPNAPEESLAENLPESDNLSADGVPEEAAPEKTKPGWRSRAAVVAALAAALLISLVVALREGDSDPDDVLETPGAAIVSGQAAAQRPEGATAGEPVPALDPANLDISQFPRGSLAGQPAPDFSFPLFDGTRFDLARFFAEDDRPLVLNIWASWCGPCRNEIPAISRVAVANPDVAFVGVAANDRFSDAQRFASEINASYPMGIEDRTPVAEVFPFVGLPTTYLIDRDGTVVRQIQGEVTEAVLQAFIDYDF